MSVGRWLNRVHELPGVRGERVGFRLRQFFRAGVAPP